MKRWKGLAIFLVVIFFIISAVYSYVNFKIYNLADWRIVYAIIVVDEDYINQNPHWMIFLPGILDEVKEFYEKEFKISLEFTNGVIIQSQRKKASIEEFSLYDTPKNDIIIGFTGRKLPEPDNKPIYGYSYSHILLITNNYPPDGQTQILKHELAHLFSALHIPGTIMDKTGEDFIMNDNPAMQNFDNLNRLIINSNKYRNFKLRKFLYSLYH